MNEVTFILTYIFVQFIFYILMYFFFTQTLFNSITYFIIMNYILLVHEITK